MDADNIKRTLSKVSFFFILVVILSIVLLYLFNIFRWKDSPDFGFGFRTATGIKVVGVVTDNGSRAGLQVGDRFLTLNGRTYTNIEELRAFSKWGMGERNTYLIERNGRQFQVTITNIPIGLMGSFSASGLPFLVGLCFALIGALVFIMKPHYRTTWIFFLFASILGLFIIFLYRTDIMKPFVLEKVTIFAYTFLPAVFIHLALSFPEERSLMKKSPYIQFLPYLPSAILFSVISHLTSRMQDTPKIWFIIWLVYMAFSIAVFLGSCLQLWITSPSEIVRLRSKVILLGTAMAVSGPLLDTLTNSLFHAYILPSFNYYLPFLVFFPLSIGYSIVKHNLFDVDLYIKRAVGYGIMTALVGTAYFSTEVTVRTVIIRQLFGDYAETIQLILFALLVVFLFNPINRKVQGAVDKLFYRKKFDYKETVISVSNALTSVLNLAEVTKKIINTVRKEMFIDTAGVVMMDHQKKECQPFFIGDGLNNIKDDIKEVCIPYDDPLLSLLSKEKKLITKYDVEEDPHYRYLKESCMQRFSEMGASMLTPMIYQGEVTGVLALGYKKSGHFYTREDIDLLNTLANHGAVAIENAKLVDQIKKEEIIRANLSRYLSPQIVEDIIKKDVRVNLGGDRRVVTVLFMDMIGFTSLSERLQPEEVVSILNEYFTKMSEAIFRWEGTLDKFAGDQIMAFWGAPTEQPSHAELAVRCAIDLSEKLDELRMRWEKEGKPVLDSGIGINTGEALVGNIGVEGKKMDYTVIGDNVNLAARVEKLTRQYKTRILFTEYTFAHIEDCLKSDRLGHIKLTDLAEVKVKGKEKGVRIYKLESIGEI